MTINKVFIKLWNINIDRKHKILKIPKNIPKHLYLLLISDGSCTLNLTNFQGTDTYIKILYQEFVLSYTKYTIDKLNKFNHLHRQVWLINKNKNKIVFAESYWKGYNDIHIHLYQHKPIGKVFIQSNKDIYRNLQSIYCGYSTDLSKELQNSDLLWGRSYTLTIYNKFIILIHELFSSLLY